MWKCLVGISLFIWLSLLYYDRCLASRWLNVVQKINICTDIWLFFSCTVTLAFGRKEHAPSKNCLAFVMFKKNEMMVGVSCKLTLWTCPCKKWHQRSSYLRGHGKMPLEKDPVQPHKWIWSLTDIGFEAKNTNAFLKQSRVGLSSRSGGFSWGKENMLNSKRKLSGGSGLNLRGPWLSMI